MKVVTIGTLPVWVNRSMGTKYVLGGVVHALNQRSMSNPLWRAEVNNENCLPQVINVHPDHAHRQCGCSAECRHLPAHVPIAVRSCGVEMRVSDPSCLCQSFDNVCRVAFGVNRQGQKGLESTCAHVNRQSRSQTRFQRNCWRKEREWRWF